MYEGNAVSSDNVSMMPDADEQPPQEEKKRRPLLPLLLAILLICGGIGVGVYTLWPKADANALVDLEGNIVVPDDADATSPAFLQAADMVEDEGGDGFSIPSVGLHVPLGSINEVDGVMNPPNFTSAFWIRNRGVSVDNAEQGTVYIVAHSVQWGKAPGNYLQDQEKILVKNGDYVQVNGRTYQITDVELILKTEIGSHAELWANTPGMLVFVTCLEKNDHSASTNNLVVVGQLV